MNGVEHVEDFYQEPLSESLIAVIATTPNDQLHVLAEQIVCSGDLTGGYAKSQDSITLRDGVPPFALDTLCLPRSVDRPLSQSTPLRRLLLYVDSLAVTDQIVLWALSMLKKMDANLIEIESDGEVDAFPAGLRLARILHGILPMRELLDSKIVQLANPPSISWNLAGAVSANLSAQYALAQAAPPILRDLLAQKYERPVNFDLTFDRDRKS